MKKRFVAVVEFEDDDAAPVDLSSLATWLEVALAHSDGVKKMEVTAYHSAEEAELDEAAGSAGSGLVVQDARLLADTPSGNMRQLCVRLADGTERMLNTYYPTGVELDLAEMGGKRVGQVHRCE